MATDADETSGAKASAEVDDPIVDLDEVELRSRYSLKWRVVPDDVLPAWVAETDFAVDPVVEDAINAAVSRGELGYVAPTHEGLRHATSAFLLRRYAWNVDPRLVIGAGDVLAAVEIALRTFCGPAPVVVLTPAYPPFFDIVPQSDRELVSVALDPDAETALLDLDAIDRAFHDGARTLLLCHPHNPWGRAFTEFELRALRDVVDRHGARVISDEVHAPLVLGEGRHVPYASIEGAGRHTTTIVSASKGWNIPGLKCAQIIAASREESDLLRALPIPANAGISPLGVTANIAAYTSDDRWLDGLCARIRTNRATFAEAMGEAAPRARMRPLEASYLQWVDARAYDLPSPGATAMERGRVFVSDGMTFGPGGEGHVRVNLATSTARVREIARRLGHAWERPLQS